jgi:pyruvate dehydrogenase E2 component (dihydrolipoamide acetyltransferase)
MNTAGGLTEVRVPDIGDFNNIPVIEVLVKPGSVIAAEDPVVTLESDKATLDVPAPMAGRVVAVDVVAGSRVSRGTLLFTLSVEGTDTAAAPASPLLKSAGAPAVVSANDHGKKVATGKPAEPQPEHSSAIRSQQRTPRSVYAGPSVRRVGRELGVDLFEVRGSGRRGRITKEDVHTWVRERLHVGAAKSNEGSTGPSLPSVDFAKYGEIERQPLSRIRRLSGPVLARNWATIPHVTNFHEADITELDGFRVSINGEKHSEVRISILSFIVKACGSALRKIPDLNASLDGHEVILKKYVHIGVAVDTPTGLLVPVLRNVDKLGVLEIASGLSAKSALARAGKLKMEEMEGGCFSISSLGGIGGDAFTPIINAPEIAILGVGKARIQPRWDGAQFAPRLILPLSLSWDHRALDGALAARFLSHVVELLEDFRRVLL